MIHLLMDEGKLDSECNDNRSVRFLYACTLFQWSNHNSPVSTAARDGTTLQAQTKLKAKSEPNLSNCDTRALDCGPE